MSSRLIIICRSAGGMVAVNIYTGSWTDYLNTHWDEHPVLCNTVCTVWNTVQCGIQSSVEYSIQCVQSAESPHYLETMAHWHTTLSSQTLSEGEIRPATRGTGSQASPGTWPGSRCGKKEKIEVAFLIFFRNCQIRSFMFCSLVQGIWSCWLAT